MTSRVIARYPPNRCIHCMFIMRSSLEDEYICVNEIRGLPLYYEEDSPCNFHFTYDELSEYYKRRGNTHDVSNYNDIISDEMYRVVETSKRIQNAKNVKDGRYG